jgi:hypothetical protein
MKCCNDHKLVDNGKYKYCKSCGVVQRGEPVFTPTGFHACPKCGCATVAQGQYCSVKCAVGIDSHGGTDQ